MEKYIMRNPPVIIVAHAALPDDLCYALIDAHCNAEEDLIEIDEYGVQTYALIEGNNDHSDCMEWIEEFIPWDEDFGKICNVRILKYGMECFRPWMCDDPEGGDTGKVIFNLNESFVGGNLSVDGHKFVPFTGSMVAFNNPTERWHGIEPVLTGERFSLVLRFTRPDDFVEPEDDMAQQELQQLLNDDVIASNDDAEERVFPKVILKN
jgi:hypothetical protein